MEQNEITYNCKASVYPPLTMVGIMTAIAMPVLFITVFIHPIVAAISMVAVMYVAILMMTGAAIFSLNSTGIQRTISTTLKLWKSKEPKTESQRWDHLKWYKEGTDRGKFSGEYRFLTLHFKNGTEWMITDNNGERFEEFKTFLLSFELLVAEHNRHISPAVAANSNIGTVNSQGIRDEKIIEQRKTIYETIWGKIFTIILELVIVFFIYLKITTPYVNNIATFRLTVILIPGFIYMWYRVFMQKK